MAVKNESCNHIETQELAPSVYITSSLREPDHNDSWSCLMAHDGNYMVDSLQNLIICRITIRRQEMTDCSIELLLLL